MGSIDPSTARFLSSGARVILFRCSPRCCVLAEKGPADVPTPGFPVGPSCAEEEAGWAGSKFGLKLKESRHLQPNNIVTIARALIIRDSPLGPRNVKRVSR
jgi:hypothetical protein